MRLKSYFAKDVKGAIAMARQELGPEAMLVHSKKAAPEARHLGDWEVVFATGPAVAGAPAVEPATVPEQLPAATPDSYDRLASEVAGMRRQLERMSSAVARATALSSARTVSDDFAQMFASLVGNEVDPELAHDVLNRLRVAGDGRDSDEALAAELAGRFSVEAQLGTGMPGPRIVALVGPCGSGKTTTLVKLAVLHGISGRRPTQLISMDSYRIAAAEQLRSYAAILGVGFQALDTTAALSQALEEHRHKDLILIDTPGHGARDLDAATDLARFLASRSDIDVHLVLTVSMKSADLSRVVDRFEVFRPRKLLFTKLDETEAYGPILNEAARTGKPVSFLAWGQQIPEDLEPATKSRIVELVRKPGIARPSAAAAQA